MLHLLSLASAFVLPTPLANSAVQHRASMPKMIDIPRITLPDAVTSALKEQGLSNPNEMSTRQYNEYSGAAIGGTLILFVLPGSLLFDVSGFFKDFAFAAIIGGGIAAYLSLRKDAAGDAANKFGATLLDTVDKLSDKL
uniref:H(+)-exporting diphosphatase n=1 Tax=Haptolina ericina TaxID=156174 RepID=A0A7S3ASX9_9EUKA|mmetsp:Transcript_32887/g.74371  ORF Transcript_32887/g.74371 Transcript_32887/m.74371 type:complete len:139 (+) Transcript_32887:8-424(+)